jgi:sulfur carrier protein ThiS
MMRITVKATGRLVRFLPAGATGMTAQLEVSESATPSDVIRQLGMPEDGSYLVVLNGASLPSAERASRPLAENDNLAIMPPLKGG